MDEQWKKIERYAYFGIAIVLIILIVLSSVSYQNLVHIRREYRSVINSREILIKLAYFISELKEAEASQLEYMLTGDEEPLEPYELLHKNVRLYFVQLKSIASKNKAQLQRVNHLEKIIGIKLHKLKDLIASEENKDSLLANQIVMSQEAKEIMEDIQATILKMDNDERKSSADLDIRISKRVRYDAFVKVTCISLIFLVAVLVITRINYWIIEYKKAQQAKQEAINIKTNFVSVVSHELRTPLKAIKEGISIVLEGLAGPTTPEQEKFMNIAKRNVDRLGKLIDNVLDFQKIAQKHISYEMKENNINKTIGEVIDLLSIAISKKRLNLIVELEDYIPGLNFDKDKIIQVLINIINNAIKFSQPGKFIRIKTSLKDNAVIVSVKDNGIGIEEQYLQKIFEEFSQVPHPSIKAHGTGLGLAISKKIIQDHNGKIWAESHSDDGTVIKFILPLVERRDIERSTCNVKEDYSYC